MQTASELPWYVEVRGESRKKKSGYTINELKTLVSISDLLDWYGLDVPAPTVYHEWVAVRCPFHEDGHPSASVSFTKQRFRCHQCDVGGDIVEVVKQVEGLSTREAMKWIRTAFNL